MSNKSKQESFDTEESQINQIEINGNDKSESTSSLNGAVLDDEIEKSEIENFELNQNDEKIENIPIDPKKNLALVNSEDLAFDSIGYRVLNSVAHKFNGEVILIGRNSKNAEKLIKSIQTNNVQFHQMNTNDMTNILKFINYLKNNYNGVDILINNFNLIDDDGSVVEIIDTNFTSVLNVFNAVYPLLNENARVVNISHRRGLLKKCSDRRLRNKIINFQTVDDLIKIVDEYVKSFEEDTTEIIGFPYSPFDMSKLAINILTKLQQKNFDDSNNEVNGIIANCICPGNTEDKIVELSFLPKNYEGPKGMFFIENDLVDWETGYFLAQTFN